jgi:hypothetical protein
MAFETQGGPDVLEELSATTIGDGGVFNHTSSGYFENLFAMKKIKSFSIPISLSMCGIKHIKKLVGRFTWRGDIPKPADIRAAHLESDAHRMIHKELSNVSKAKLKVYAIEISGDQPSLDVLHRQQNNPFEEKFIVQADLLLLLEVMDSIWRRFKVGKYSCITSLEADRDNVLRRKEGIPAPQKAQLFFLSNSLGKPKVEIYQDSVIDFPHSLGAQRTIILAMKN